MVGIQGLVYCQMWLFDLRQTKALDKPARHLQQFHYYYLYIYVLLSQLIYMHIMTERVVEVVQVRYFCSFFADLKSP